VLGVPAADQPDLGVVFRRRAIASAVAAGAVALAGVFVLNHDAPQLFHGLTHGGAPLIALSAAAGAAFALRRELSYLPTPIWWSRCRRRRG
jgi:hypothetical protein